MSGETHGEDFSSDAEARSWSGREGWEDLEDLEARMGSSDDSDDKCELWLWKNRR